MAFAVARQLIVMSVIILVGFFFSRKNNFGEIESQCLSKLLLFVINPCVILSAFNVDFDFEKLKALGFVIFLSVIFHFVMVLVAMIFIRKKIDDNGRNDLARLSVVFTNSGFIGIPLIKGVFGDEGVFYLMGYLFVFNILLWTWGEWTMTGKMNAKKIFTNPNVIASLLGVAIFCLPFKIPYVVMEPFRMIGNCNAVVAMLLLGLLFSMPHKSGSLALYKALLLRDSVLRLVLCPLLILPIVLAVVRFADFGEMRLIASVLFIATACPVGINVSGIAVLFGKDSAYTGFLVLVTTAACIATIPLLVLLMQVLM